MAMLQAYYPAFVTYCVHAAVVGTSQKQHGQMGADCGLLAGLQIFQGHALASMLDWDCLDQRGDWKHPESWKSFAVGSR